MLGEREPYFAGTARERLSLRVGALAERLVIERLFQGSAGIRYCRHAPEERIMMQIHRLGFREILALLGICYLMKSLTVSRIVIHIPLYQFGKVLVIVVQ